jgi:HD-like signal output (HDOD) protein
MNPKIRILFVDDEPLILQGLQRLLHPMRAEWSLTFVEGGAQALEIMATQPFEAVVSDMRMPGMNGAKFLTEVMQRHPRTIRLVLSGQADKEMFLRCVHCAHQFLAKPCELEALETTLKRISDLASSPKGDLLLRLVPRMAHLPSFPDLYAEMIEKLQDPDASSEEIGAIIRKDIGMTTKVLNLVNSAFFGLQREVASPSEAVSYLGIGMIKSLVLALEVFHQFDGALLPGLFLKSVWSHSLETAGLAAAIAAAEQADEQTQEECFVAGMLHDAGKLTLALNFGLKYGEAIQLTRQKGQPLWSAEEQVFGVNHAEVGGHLLGLLGLPVRVVEAIALHHHPRLGIGPGFSPLLAVHVANAWACPRQDAALASAHARLDMDYLAESGVAGRLDNWRQVCQQNQALVA